MILSLHWLMLPVWQESEVKYCTAPMFTLHQINAFEDSGFLIMDMCCGDDGELIGEFTLENLRRHAGEEMDEVNPSGFSVFTKSKNTSDFGTMVFLYPSLFSSCIVLHS